ncbi:MAG TPA: hypothetical protein VNK44_08570 [Candidatus Nitrosotenuis sp.]|nr:hypothetical protein [Candidatus Nitrosotenuis sp.]
MWKLELDGDFFRIFDKNHKIAGYFVPDYGQLFPEENADEIIEKMHKNHDKIPGGFLTVPMVKFGIFDSKEDMDILYLQNHVEDATSRIEAWKEFLLEHQMQHAINISYTDNDMLSLTFPIKFAEHVQLEKKTLLDALEPTLDLLQQKGLL